MVETTTKKDLCVFHSKIYGKVKLPVALVDKWGKDKIQQVVKYVDAYNVHIRNWPAYISSALAGGWDLSVSEGDFIPEEITHVPGVEETRKYIHSINIKRDLTSEDHEKVRNIVDDFLANVGSSRAEVDRKQRRMGKKLDA